MRNLAFENRRLPFVEPKIAPTELVPRYFDRIPLQDAYATRALLARLFSFSSPSACVLFEYGTSDLANGYKTELTKVKTYVMQQPRHRKKTTRRRSNYCTNSICTLRSSRPPLSARPRNLRIAARPVSP